MKKGVHVATYRSWQMMKNRCLNKKAEDFKYYGGRGITVDRRWLIYEGFLASMGERPDGMTLDRRDGDKNYTPANCRWATRLTQSRNRDYTLGLTHNGVTLKVWEWEKRLKLWPRGMHYRLWRHKRGEISLARVFEPNRNAK